MVKLLDVWNTATGRGSPANGATSPVALLTDADLNWEDGDFDPDDPDLPEFVRDRLKEKQYEKQAAAGFEQKQHQTDQAAKESEAAERDRRMREWLASEQYRRAYQALCDDISDAKVAAREAYGRALTKEQAALEALEKARRHALVVSGNLVYFTRDGKHLYGEDGREITDADSVAEARRQQSQHPDATTYEDFVDRWKVHDEARRKVDQLHATLDKLDELDTRIKRGNLSPEELAQAQRETKEIIDSMPPETREAYEQRKSVREQPEAEYRSAAAIYTDAESFRTAVDASGHFNDAVAGRTAPKQSPASQPGPKPVTQNTDDYRQGF